VCVPEVENSQQQVQTSEPIRLALSTPRAPAPVAPISPTASAPAMASAAARDVAETASEGAVDLSDDLLRYLRAATNPQQAPGADWDSLVTEQREILLDFGLSEGPASVPADVLAAVLARDWGKFFDSHRYVRYAGPAPDHVRNKAFAERWIYSGRLNVKKPQGLRFETRLTADPLRDEPWIRLLW